jgi:hypothetical protein
VRIGLERDLLGERVIEVVAVLQAAGAAAIDDGHALDHHQAVAGAAAVHHEIHSGLRNGAADVLADTRDEHRRCQRGEAHEVAVRRQDIHHLARSGGFANDILCIDDRALAGDRHRLLQRPHRKIGIHVGREGRRQFDAVAAQGIEALEREGHAVYPWSQVDDLVLPLAIGYGGTHPFDERRAAGFNGNARQHGAGRVAHHTCNRGLALREGRTCHQDDE